ncbi:nucleotidyltransferase domain protein [bacterium BMS3Bbin04]|nr:nucleotidyltransferase domain protein [bacterium BMS3Bbin04]
MSKRITREEVLDYIRQSKARWKQDYGIMKIAIFGSYARDEHTDTSDIDIMIEMEPTTFDGFMNLKYELEDHFGRKVDLATRPAIKERMLPYIEKDLIYA